jgi:hypothetical protein
MKIFLSILALIVSITGVYIGWRQYQKSQENEQKAEPSVVVCLKSLTYQRSNTQGSGNDAVSVPKGQASFRLINKGGAEVMVTRVMLNPAGTWKDGRHGGLGSIYITVDKQVPANGVVSVDNLDFVADFGVQEEFWIDKPETVNTRAYWPSGEGPMLTCVPSGGGWSCGTGSGAIVVDPACQ